MHGRLSARARFIQACGFQWAGFGGKVSLLEAARFDFSFARLDEEYSFYRWLVLDVTSPQSNLNFFC